ncbi:MAG: TIR domain-containing protein [Symploca sp. SIO2E9]|nr:TIR domain-containing protein [Symploca sp. SIO2E9]
MTVFFDAFISYGRADSKAFATKLHHQLTAFGFKVWFDQNDIPPAVDWQRQIDDDIEKAHNFIFIIAPHAVNSAYCLKEIKQAIKYNKRIIPLLHIKSSEDKMHPAIRKFNWLHFQEDINSFEESFEKLINTIHQHYDYVEQHTKFLTKALEWSRNKKQTNYLLIGAERIQAESWLKERFKNEQFPCEPTDLQAEFICESIKNANNLMTQVFISYSDKYQYIRNKIEKTLQLEGITIWKPDTDIKTGIEFSEAINEGIEEADNFVYLLSANSLLSKSCQQELEYALTNNKRLIILTIDTVDSQQIPAAIRGLQFIDFRGYEDENKYQVGVAKLLKELHQETRYYQEHKILLVKALKWQRQNLNHSILLRGHNLQYYQNWLKVHRQRLEHPPLALHAEFIVASVNQPTGLSQEVFISYSSADSDFARKLNEALQLQGKTTWFDQESIPPGTDFQQEIYRGIESSDNFLFIISPNAVNSPYCDDEIQYATKLNKRLITVLYSEVSTKELHPLLAQVQWIDFRRYGGDFYFNFSQVIRTMDSETEHLRNHTKWLQRSLEWEQKHRSEDLLLRGTELAIAQDWLTQAQEQNKHPALTPLQKEYITKSSDAVLAALKQKKLITLILWSLLGLMSAVFVVALSQFSRGERLLENQINILSQSSKTFRDSNQPFEALLSALRARKLLLEKQLGVKPNTRNRVKVALQDALYEVKERNRLQGHHSAVISVVFSPDGKTIATASADKTAKLWSFEGKLLQTLTGHTDWVYSVSFSPDGKTIATASADNTVKLWSFEGKLLQTLTGHTDWVRSASFSSDGKTIVSASLDNTVILWSLDGKLLQTLRGHNEPIRDVGFSPDGKTIASASGDKTVKLWSHDGKLIQTLRGHNEPIRDVSFSPDGSKIATTSLDKTVKIWSREGKLLQSFTDNKDEVYSVSFSADGKTIVTANGDNTAKLWNLNGTQLQIFAGHQGDVYSVSFSPDGKTIATASEDKTAKLWNIKIDNKLLKILTEHEDWIRSVSFSPDGKMIASASDDKTVKLWTKDGKLLQTLTGHSKRVFNVSFSPDSQIIATASEDKNVKLWSNDGKLLQTIAGHTDWVRNVSFSPDGKLIATASRDKSVKLWSKDGILLKTITRHRSGVNSVSFSPDSQMIAIASNDQNLTLWNLDGKLLKTLMGHSDYIVDVSFSPDGKTIATASNDNTAKLWSKDGRELKSFTGHNGDVNSVSFSSDGQTIATTSADKTIKLWNLDGKLLKTLADHDKPVFDVNFSPDNQTIAIASQDQSVILWNLDLDFGRLGMIACEWVGDYLKHNRNVEKGDQHLCNLENRN